MINKTTLITFLLLYMTSVSGGEYISPIGEYDFSRDYRKELEEEHHKAIVELGKTLSASIEGVDLRQYANIQAKVAANQDETTLLKAAGIDQATWQHVKDGWIKRIRQDKTYTVSNQYSIYFFEAVPGRFADAGKSLSIAMRTGALPVGNAPVTLDKWMAISQQMKASQNPTAVIQAHGFNSAEWSVISNWWAKHLQLRDPKTLKAFIELSNTNRK